jgi:uncharacterized protein YndB with AHSA1/START domain
MLYMPNTKDLKIEKTFNAPPEKVFEAWTNRELISKWFSPFPGVDAQVLEFSAAPGGRAHILVPNPQGGDPLIFLVTYISLNPGAEIKFQVSGETEVHSPVITAKFEPEGNGTKMIFDSPDIPEDRFEDASRGWYAFFEKLEKVLNS